jgi:hypothetical protein
MLPGVAALLLQRGCPDDRLDEALDGLSATQLPTTLTEAVEHADRAVASLNARPPIDTTAT